MLTDAEEKFIQLKNSLGLWTDKLVDVTERLTVQLATMGMKSWGFSISQKEATSVRLTLFFEGLIDVLDGYHKERAAKFAAESRKLLHDVLFKVLVKITCTGILASTSPRPSPACLPGRTPAKLRSLSLPSPPGPLEDPSESKGSSEIDLFVFACNSCSPCIKNNLIFD